MNDSRQALHDLIEEAEEEDLPTLVEAVSRFQRPLDFARQSVSASPKAERERRRQELLLEADLISRGTHLIREHIAKTARSLGINPARIECTAGGASIGGDSVTVDRHWSEGSASYRLNTFVLEDHEIITFNKAETSNSGSELFYNVRVLTAKAESEIELNVPL